MNGRRGYILLGLIATIAALPGLASAAEKRPRSVMEKVAALDQRVTYTETSGPAEEPGYGQHRDYGLSETLPIVLDGDEIETLSVNALLR
jgi:hypothetical protein